MAAAQHERGSWLYPDLCDRGWKCLEREREKGSTLQWMQANFWTTLSASEYSQRSVLWKINTYGKNHGERREGKHHQFEGTRKRYSLCGVQCCFEEYHWMHTSEGYTNDSVFCVTLRTLNALDWVCVTIWNGWACAVCWMMLTGWWIHQGFFIVSVWGWLQAMVLLMLLCGPLSCEQWGVKQCVLKLSV